MTGPSQSSQRDYNKKEKLFQEDMRLWQQLAMYSSSTATASTVAVEVLEVTE